MMNKEKIFIFLLFLVSILIISPISAESIDDIVALEDGSSVNDDVPLSEDVQTLDENAQDSLKSEVQDDNLLEDDSQNEIKGSFRDLQQQIDDAEGVLNLSYDFAYSESIDGDYFVDGIYVYDKSITINGNGHNISGENLARIFWFDLYGAEATLNNLTLISGSYDEGGAVYVDRDSTLYINDVNFFKDFEQDIYVSKELQIEDIYFPYSNYMTSWRGLLQHMAIRILRIAIFQIMEDR